MSSEKTTAPSIDELMVQAREAMDMVDPQSAEYSAMVTNLKTLDSMRQKKTLERIDPNVVISSLGSVTGIAMILFHERTAVVASKALSFVTKIRI